MLYKMNKLFAVYKSRINTSLMKLFWLFKQLCNICWTYIWKSAVLKLLECGKGFKYLCHIQYSYYKFRGDCTDLNLNCTFGLFDSPLKRIAFSENVKGFILPLLGVDSN